MLLPIVVYGEAIGFSAMRQSIAQIQIMSDVAFLGTCFVRHYLALKQSA